MANRDFTAVRESILIMEEDPGAIVIEYVLHSNSFAIRMRMHLLCKRVDSFFSC